MNLSRPVETRGVIPSELKKTADAPISLLVVSESEQPHLLVHNLLTQLKWTLHSAFSCAQATELMENREFGVILCDTDLSDGSWKTLLEEAQNKKKPPRLVVFCRYAGVALWGEVLNLGAWDLLVYPFEPQEVIRATALAWESWAREGQRKSGIADLDAASPEHRPAVPRTSLQETPHVLHAMRSRA